MKSYPGSRWRKWDLHVHTPMSLVHEYAGESDAAWEKFLTDLEGLPEEFKVIGINDYIFLDGYRRVMRERSQNGRLKNIEMILPVVELRLDKFGGSGTALSRVNYHVVFSNDVSVDVIQTQFLNALHSDYKLSPEYADIQESGEWNSVPTIESLKELGAKIIATVPEERRKDYDNPLKEGFNNLCFKFDDVLKALKKTSFSGKYVTAIGKTEWADVKWNDNTIAEKKSIINKTDFVFTASQSVQSCQNARKALKLGGVNARLLDCSDAHRYSDSPEKDRIGNCGTWIKGDVVFETLRQALFDFDNRVEISDSEPLMPLLRIEEVVINLPEETSLVSEDQSSSFCLRGKHNIQFSPYLTCIIGGRGSGKSTILNILHEKLQPGYNPFFKQAWLKSEQDASISNCVIVDGDKESKEVEFILQNEVELFAKDPARLTAAIYSRILKLDQAGGLAGIIDVANAYRDELERQGKRISQLASSRIELMEKLKELERNRSLVQSFSNEEYRGISDELAKLNWKHQALVEARGRYDSIIAGLGDLLASSDSLEAFSVDIYNEHLDAPADYAIRVYEHRIKVIRDAVGSMLSAEVTDAELDLAQAEQINLESAMAESQVRLEVFLRERGLSIENQNDVGKATERVAVLSQQIARIRQTIDQLEVDAAKFKRRDELTSEFAAAMHARLSPINEGLRNLGAEVKPIVLEYGFDRASLNMRMRERLRSRLPVEEKLRADHIDKVFERIDFVEPLSYNEFMRNIPEDGKTAKIIRDFFATELNFELMMLEARALCVSFADFQRIKVTYDGRPIENSSFGQRCTAAIVILISLGNNPIIIDEPEAHLDSKLIAKYLVGLIKHVKRNRQIIFATHNANFVINGDAELIYILDMNSDHKTVIHPSTIEQVANRERLLSLEGGRDAFKLREKRYGISDIKISV